MANVIASFDLNTLEGKKRLFNAKTGASTSMKTLDDGFEIDVAAVLLYPDTTDTYGKPQDVTVTVLFDVNGDAYSSVSETIAHASESLIEFLSIPEVDSAKVKLIRAESRQGNEFLNLQLV